MKFAHVLPTGLFFSTTYRLVFMAASKFQSTNSTCLLPLIERITSGIPRPLEPSVQFGALSALGAFLSPKRPARFAPS